MEKEERLIQLAQKYETDKLEHGYIPYYAKHLPDNPVDFLEIGCFKGASVKMWKEYYYSGTQIYTMDLFAGAENIPKNQIENEGIIAYKGNQKDIEFLSRINQKFDVIIDDGSHNSDAQQITFKHFFLNNLKSGGLYIIEDLHCCEDPFYWQDSNIDNFQDTILSVLWEYIRVGEIRNRFFSNSENEIFKGVISNVEMYDEKIVFIWKK